EQQETERHPFTGAFPGGWGWSHLPGSVPDADDTAGALLALSHLLPNDWNQRVIAGIKWLCELRNRDGGWPTFCRGWGKLPFDRSGADLTAHALRGLDIWNVTWSGGHAQTSRDVAPRLKFQSVLERDLIWSRWLAVPLGLEYLTRHQRHDGSW